MPLENDCQLACDCPLSTRSAEADPRLGSSVSNGVRMVITNADPRINSDSFLEFVGAAGVRLPQLTALVAFSWSSQGYAAAERLRSTYRWNSSALMAAAYRLP